MHLGTITCSRSEQLSALFSKVNHCLRAGASGQCRKDTCGTESHRTRVFRFRNKWKGARHAAGQQQRLSPGILTYCVAKITTMQSARLVRIDPKAEKVVVVNIAVGKRTVL